jgi:Lrp/AsnC family transcriptional regulator, leucine-responsive regulatory protein
MAGSLDAIDRKILTALQADGRMSITELSAVAGLSKTPCTERVKRLEREGHISSYRAVIDPVRVGLAMTVFVQVQLDRTTTHVLDRFNDEVRRIPEVEAAHMIAGGFDYLLKVRTRDMAHYRKVLGDRIGTLAGVSQTHTYAVMETVVENRGVHPALL